MLTTEIKDKACKMALGQIEGSMLDVFDLLIPAVCPNWDEMDEEERSSYHIGFVNGFRACNEMSIHIAQTQLKSNKKGEKENE